MYQLCTVSAAQIVSYGAHLTVSSHYHDGDSVEAGDESIR